jgi:hypothetical protein
MTVADERSAFEAVIVERMTQMASTLQRIEGTLSGFVLKAVYESDKSAVARRIEELEDGNRWRGRAVFGAIIAALVGPMVTLLLQGKR